MTIHHIVCRGCGAVADVDCVAGAAPCLDLSASGGFVIDEADVTFWGVCPACQQPAATRRPRGRVLPEGN